MPLENIQTIFDNKLKDPQYKESYLKEKADVITLSNSENGASYYLDSLLK